MKRPWAGVNEEINEERPEFDPRNPLCPGVKRPSGKVKECSAKLFELRDHQTTSQQTTVKWSLEL